MPSKIKVGRENLIEEGASPKALDLPTANPEKVGMSSKRLGRIRPAMQRYVDEKLVPGVVSLVARNGRVVYLDAVGWRDVEADKPMRTNTIFRIASMTKPITSVALMMLYEKGHFLLSDPISRWIPEFANPKVAEVTPSQEHRTEGWRLVPAARPITMLHLLTHTAGFGNVPRSLSLEEFNNLKQRQSPNEVIGDFVRRYATIPLNYQPGEAWDYSRATCVIAYLVEIISGMTINEFFRKYIFQPLNMVDTYFYLPKEKNGRFAVCYKPGKDNRIEVDRAPVVNRYINEPCVYFSGSGGLVSTVADYFRFDQMMLNGGELDGVRILGRKTVELMTRNHTGDLPLWIPGPAMGFGLGYAVVRNTDHINTLTSGHPGPVPWSVGSYHWGGAFCTYQWVDPVERLIGIMMSQVGPYHHLNIRHDFIGLAYQAIAD